VLACISPLHHTILSTLALLSNSLLSGRALPPFMPLPEPYEVTRQVLELNPALRDAGHVLANDEPVRLDVSTGKDKSGSSGGRGTENGDGEDDDDDDRISAEGGDTAIPGVRDLLDPDNMEQPGYTEFAVMQVCATLICGDLEELIRCVSSLVGVVDFSFRVDISNSSSDDDLTQAQRSGTERSDTGGDGKDGLRKRSAGKGSPSGS